jgi:hypothetical protein
MLPMTWRNRGFGRWEMSHISPEWLKQYLPHAPPTLLFQLYFIFVQKQNWLLTNLIIMKKSMWKYGSAINSFFVFFHYTFKVWKDLFVSKKNWTRLMDLVKNLKILVGIVNPSLISLLQGEYCYLEF